MLQTVDKVCFVWKLEDDNVKTIISPAVSGRLFTFQCGLKRSNNFIDLFIFISSQVDFFYIIDFRHVSKVMAKNMSIKTINKWDNLKCQKSMYSVTVEPQIRRHPFGGISVSFAGFINNK